MAKVYNEEFKKQLVKEYIQGKSYPALEKVFDLLTEKLEIKVLQELFSVIPQKISA